MNSLHENFKDIRRFYRYTQERLADEMGMIVKTVQRIEKGTRKLQIDELQKLGSIFNLTLVDIISWPEKWVPEKQPYKMPSENINQVNEGLGYCVECRVKDEKIKGLKKEIENLNNHLEDLRRSNAPPDQARNAS